jgi:hypothetical protein
MNQIFGYQILSEGKRLNNIRFDGTQPVEVSVDVNRKDRQMNLFAGPHTSLQSCFSDNYGAYCYIWGIPAHPLISKTDIPEWCIKAVAEKSYYRFKELIGAFIIIIDEPKEHRLTFVSDVLGLRPMFLGRNNGRIVFGSQVWPLYNAGLSTGKIDYDAVSAWITYKYNCTEGSLFSDLRRLPPGSVVVIHEGKQTQFRYAIFSPKSQPIHTAQAADDLHHIIAANVKTLLTDHSKISISLSGGYDSRYLLALISSSGTVSFECTTVDYLEEGKIAFNIAETLGVPLKSIPVVNSQWDLYDDVYHCMADGFPISKYITYCIAQQYPAIPMTNGFLGDSLAPVSEDTHIGKYETELNGNLADILHFKNSDICSKLLREDIAHRVQIRSRIPVDKAVQEGSKIGKVFAWFNFFYRLRYYTSNNFLQHLDITEALLPFYSYDTVAYKMEHDYRLFNRGIYHHIFQTYFPELVKIPHASDLQSVKLNSRVARCTKQWARHMFPISCNGKYLSLLNKKWSIPLNIAGITGLYRAEWAIFLFERLYMLEKSTRDAGLDFDWESI